MHYKLYTLSTVWSEFHICLQRNVVPKTWTLQPQILCQEIPSGFPDESFPGPMFNPLESVALFIIEIHFLSLYDGFFTLHKRQKCYVIYFNKEGGGEAWIIIQSSLRWREGTSRNLPSPAFTTWCTTITETELSSNHRLT